MMTLPVLSESFYRRWSTVADLVIINLLTLLACLPVITAGAALTACSWATGRLLRGEDEGAFHDWWLSLRTNLRQTLAWWVIVLICVYAAVSLLRASSATGTEQFVIALPQAAGLVVAALVAVILTWLVPLTAFFENSLPAHALNAMVLAARYTPRTLACLAITLCPWCVVALVPGSTGLIATLYVCIGFSGTSFLIACVQRSVVDGLRNRASQHT